LKPGLQQVITPDGLTAALWQALPVYKQLNLFTVVGPRRPLGEFQRSLSKLNT